MANINAPSPISILDKINEADSLMLPPEATSELAAAEDVSQQNDQRNVVDDFLSLEKAPQDTSSIIDGEVFIDESKEYAALQSNPYGLRTPDKPEKSE